MRLFSVLLVSSSLAFGSLAHAQSAPEDLRRFLMTMGLEDYVAQVRQAQQQGLQYNEMNRRQQLRNMKTYETVNASRELAISIYSELGARIDDPETAKNLVEFTAKMLALQPLAPMTDYPADVMSKPAGEERTEAVNDWLEAQRRAQMETHTRQIVSDIGVLLYGKDLSAHEKELTRIYDLVGTIVDRMYLDTLVGETRYLGRGLAALLARHAKLNNRASLVADLSNELRKFDIHLENFLGDEWVVDSSKGPRKVKIETGSMLLTRNLSKDSLQIALGAVSTVPESKKIAKKMGLTGKLRASPFFVTAEDASDGLSDRERRHDKIQQLNLPLSAGFSHVVYVLVKEDPATGLKMSYTVDNYPQMAADSSGILANPGGVRITGFEQVIDTSHHSKIAIGNLNHQKFHAWSQESSKVIGYPKDGVIYDSYAIEMKDGENVLPAKPKSDPWTIQISKAEYDRLHGMTNADEWYKAASDNFINKGMMDLFKRGVYFQWVTAGAYYKGGAYCSQSGFLAWLQSNGDFIERPYSPGKGEQYKAKLDEMQKTIPGFKPSDGWSWHVRFLAKVGNFAKWLKEKNVFTGVSDKVLANGAVQQSMLFSSMDIVAPSSMLAQDYVESQVIDMKDRTLENRWKMPYRDYTEKNRSATEEVERLLPRSNSRFQRHLTASLDASDVAGAAMRDIEYRMAVYGSRGVKTEGISAETVAEIGSNRSLDVIRKDWEKRGRPGAAEGVKCEKAL